MNQEYKLAIVPNYKKSIFRILLMLSIIIFIIVLFGILLKTKIISENSIDFKIALPIFFACVIMVNIVVIRKSFITDVIRLNNDFLESNKIGRIDFENITSYKKVNRGDFKSYIITFVNGDKLSLGPKNNFSNHAEKVYETFIEQFEQLVNNKK